MALTETTEDAESGCNLAANGTHTKWQVKHKCGAAPFFALNPDPTLVSLDNLLADR